MGKKGCIALAALFAVVLGGLTWQFVGAREPIFHGKPLQHYLEELAAHYPPKSADDPSVRAIHEMGPKAIPHLRRAFRRKNSAYVKALVFLRANLPKEIARRLPDPKPNYLRDLSKASAHALATFGPTAKEALPDLIKGLDDGITANMATYAITEIGPQPENLPAFLSLMKSTNWPAPLYAATCIGKIGLATPEVLAALSNAAERETSLGRTTAIDALGDLGPKAESATAVLTRSLSDTNARVRISSTAALWKIRGKTNAPVPWLTKVLEDELKGRTAPSRRPSAFYEREINLLMITGLLKELRKEAQPASALLHLVTRERDVRLRMNAVEALWRIQGETNGIVPVCLEALAHSDANVRVFGARLLVEFCVEERVVLSEFEEMLTSSDTFIRFYAARACWKLKGEKDNTLSALILGLRDHFTYYRNAEIRQLAAETLGDMEVAARPAVPALLVALNDGVEGVRIAATNALKRIAPETRVKAGVK